MGLLIFEIVVTYMLGFMLVYPIVAKYNISVSSSDVFVHTKSDDTENWDPAKVESQMLCPDVLSPIIPSLV